MWLTDLNRVRLARGREMLADTAGPDLPIARIARELGVSPFHFIRRFESVFGVTPHQFRIQQKLDRAKMLLASGRCSVTDACLEVGFSSIGTFSALFTRRVGEAPSVYRRRMRAVLQVPDAPRLLTPGCLSLIQHLPPSAFRSFREAPSPAPER